MAAASGFVLALAAWAAATRATLWIAEDRTLAESGALYGPGLETFGLEPEQLIRVAVSHERAVLWAMEEALRCRGVGAVIGEIRGRGVGLTASRRLALAAGREGATAFLLRASPNDEAIAAATRWVVGVTPSARNRAWPRAAASRLASHTQPAGQPGIVGVGVEQWRAAFRPRGNGSPACG